MSRVFSLITVVCAWAVIIVHSYLEGYSQEDRTFKTVLIAWIASLIVVVASFYNHRYHVDKDRFVHVMIQTNYDTGSVADPQRFLTVMPYCQIMGLIATIVIYYTFIGGMLCYLAMHLLNMYSFSGIIYFPQWGMNAPTEVRTKYYTLGSCWLVLMLTVFFTFVFKGAGSLVVIPYLLCLGSMACTTCFAFCYHERPLLFRLVPMLGAIIFAFSDSLIGHGAYRDEHPLDFIIDPTYVMGISMINSAVLFAYDSGFDDSQPLTMNSDYEEILDEEDV